MEKPEKKHDIEELVRTSTNREAFRKGYDFAYREREGYYKGELHRILSKMRLEEFDMDGVSKPYRECGDILKREILELNKKEEERRNAETV